MQRKSGNEGEMGKAHVFYFHWYPSRARIDPAMALEKKGGPKKVGSEKKHKTMMTTAAVVPVTGFWKGQ